GRAGGQLHERRSEVRCDAAAPRARVRRRGDRDAGALRSEDPGVRAQGRRPQHRMGAAARACRATGVEARSAFHALPVAPAQHEPVDGDAAYNFAMEFWSDSFADGAAIPANYAFCAPDPAAHVKLSQNRNPHLAWSDLPKGTQSVVIICHDPDVPSKPDDVNQEGRTVPAALPRVNFCHWV